MFLLPLIAAGQVWFCAFYFSAKTENCHLSFNLDFVSQTGSSLERYSRMIILYIIRDDELTYILKNELKDKVAG